MTDDDILIVAGARTPMGALGGALAGVPAPELAAVAARATLERAGVPADAVDEVFMGCVLPAGLRQCPARQTAIAAGVPVSAGAVTVNKACGSGMQATIFGIDSIRAGTNRVVLAGGMESMSNAPHLLPGARSGFRLGSATAYDHMMMDGLEDAYEGRPMGSYAQETADREGLTREAMDAYAIESLRRARAAIERGVLRDEIAPVSVTTRRGTQAVADDEQPQRADIERIPQLKPAFASDGTITAANASSISDGGSALLLMTVGDARKRGISGLARIVAHARHSQAPGEFTTAPVGAISKLLETTGWSADSVDLYEINEAFAMVTMLAMRDHGLDHARVNVHGGACAQGHPIGSTGSRIIVTLAHALRRHGGKRGVAALCIGGGEATAIAIEAV
ncbi:MAG: acetyl-CoA C-acyltransferase [Halieaceae bacterium]|jgi:acetyl-CoA C-acetyltransferase|nr:acetyl-CoA C-acyltransferase [Halieaceae bacterium]